MKKDELIKRLKAVSSIGENTPEESAREDLNTCIEDMMYKIEQITEEIEKEDE